MPTTPNPPDPSSTSSSPSKGVPAQPTPNFLQQAWDEMTRSGLYVDAEPESYAPKECEGRATLEITFHRAPAPLRRRASTAKKPRQRG